MTTSTVLFLVSTAALLVFLKRDQNRQKLPPHRKGWPILGNALEMPLTSVAPTYASWAKELGEFLPPPLRCTTHGLTVLLQVRTLSVLTPLVPRSLSSTLLTLLSSCWRSIPTGHRQGASTIIMYMRCAQVFIANHDSRPASIMANEFLGFDFFITLLPYGEAWKHRRRLFVKHFRVGHDGSGPHTERTEEFVHRFLLDVKETPDEFYQLVHQ